MRNNLSLQGLYTHKEENDEICLSIHSEINLSKMEFKISIKEVL